MLTSFNKQHLIFVSGSTLIDKFEQFEMTTDLKITTPREARLGRWVLLYGILQVLSTLSVDVQGIKHTEGVRYFLCTDLKRLPEWVVNGHLEHLEASQKRSWCWQRAWDPAPTQTAPVELEAIQTQDQPPAPIPPTNNELSATRDREWERDNNTDQPPPLDLNNNGGLDGQTLVQNDILRLTEKIHSLALPPNTNATQHFASTLSLRRENEKSKQSDFSDWKPRYDSLPQPPHPTPASLARDTYRSPNFSPAHDFPRSDFEFSLPARETTRTDRGGHPFSREEMSWPVPPGYSEREHGAGIRESGIGYSVNGGGLGWEWKGRGEGG